MEQKCFVCQETISKFKWDTIVARRTKHEQYQPICMKCLSDKKWELDSITGYSTSARIESESKSVIQKSSDTTSGTSTVKKGRSKVVWGVVGFVGFFLFLVASRGLPVGPIGAAITVAVLIGLALLATNLFSDN